MSVFSQSVQPTVLEGLSQAGHSALHLEVDQLMGPSWLLYVCIHTPLGQSLSEPWAQLKTARQGPQCPC